jgi:hypothetical protein
MSMPQGDDEPDPDREAGKQADAMKDQLRKDVASWSAARTAGSGGATFSREAAEARVPVPVQPNAAQSVGAQSAAAQSMAAHVAAVDRAAVEPAAPRARRPKPVAPPAAAPAAATRKPFRMSYDGVTEADYITYIIERGA